MHLPRPTLSRISTQHAEEAASLWLLSNNTVTEAHHNLEHLQRLEKNIKVHIDDLRVAGDEGGRWSLENIHQSRKSGDIFAAVTLRHSDTKHARDYGETTSDVDYVWVQGFNLSNISSATSSNSGITITGWKNQHHTRTSQFLPPRTQKLLIRECSL